MEFTARLGKDRLKWRARFRTCAILFPSWPVVDVRMTPAIFLNAFESITSNQILKKSINQEY